jgi:hypothetical protein
MGFSTKKFRDKDTAAFFYYTGCKVYPFFFPNWIDLISAVLIALQFGKKKGKIFHPVIK